MYQKATNKLFTLALLFIQISPIILGVQLILLVASCIVIGLNLGESPGKSFLDSIGILMGDSYEKFDNLGIKLWWITPILLTVLRFSGWFITPILVAILLSAYTKEQDRTEIITSKVHVSIRTRKNQERRQAAIHAMAEEFRKRGLDETEIKNFEQDLE